MELTELQKTVAKTVQEEQYEPFRAENTVTARLEPGDSVQEVGDKLYHVAAMQTNADLMKRALEINMDPETLQKVMADHPVIVDEEVVLPGDLGVVEEQEEKAPWE